MNYFTISVFILVTVNAHTHTKCVHMPNTPKKLAPPWIILELPMTTQYLYEYTDNNCIQECTEF